MCAKDGRRPKFYELLDYHPDGSYSMKEDGSTDGYWKLLIDFKMYDNDGNGAEQMPVKPIFNMGNTGSAEMDAHSIPAALDKYKGGHENFPVAEDIVKEFIEYKTGKTVSDEEVDKAIADSKGVKRGSGWQYGPQTEQKQSRNYSAAQDRNALIEEYKKPITLNDIRRLQTMFPDSRSINSFTPKDIRAAGKWAYKYFKQMGVKSPFFRAWFGDWRAHDIKNYAKVATFAYGETGKLNTETRYIKNNDSGFNIKIDDTVIGDSLHYAGVYGDKKQISQLLYRIDEIVKNAVYLDTKTTAPDRMDNKKGTSIFIHSLYCPVSINGAPFIAKLAVEEYSADGKTRAYNLQRIKMSDLQRASFQDLIQKNKVDYALRFDALTVAQLYSFVKKYDKDFVAGPEVAPECTIRRSRSFLMTTLKTISMNVASFTTKRKTPSKLDPGV